jgi:hypothetical protein
LRVDLFDPGKAAELALLPVVVAMVVAEPAGELAAEDMVEAL